MSYGTLKLKMFTFYCFPIVFLYCNLFSFCLKSCTLLLLFGFIFLTLNVTGNFFSQSSSYYKQKKMCLLTNKEDKKLQGTMEVYMDDKLACENKNSQELTHTISIIV